MNTPDVAQRVIAIHALRAKKSDEEMMDLYRQEADAATLALYREVLVQIAEHSGPDLGQTTDGLRHKASLIQHLASVALVAEPST
jgi:hypothetical protein